MEYTQNYWKGPYGILVSYDIDSVVAKDGFNTLYKNGEETEMCGEEDEEMTREEYFQKYATLNSDGFYYYKQEDYSQSAAILKDDSYYFKLDGKSTPQGFWTGPYGVLVPNNIGHVVAQDGGNDFSKDGDETEIFCPDPPTKEEYLLKYATLNSDGFYYYKN
jgi:hypothetical protein